MNLAKFDGVTLAKSQVAAIITDSEHVILSAFQAETISNRLSDETAEDEDEELS